MATVYVVHLWAGTCWKMKTSISVRLPIRRKPEGLRGSKPALTKTFQQTVTFVSMSRTYLGLVSVVLLTPAAVLNLLHVLEQALFTLPEPLRDLCSCLVLISQLE